MTGPCNGYPWQQFLATGKREGKKIVVVFVLIYVYFELIMKVIDDDAFDDDERKKSKKTNFVSNDRSGHDEQNAY